MNLSPKIILLWTLFLSSVVIHAQEEEPQTIRIKKESNILKAVFDNTELRLLAIDRFGNPKENKIVSFLLWVKGQGEGRPLNGFSNSLSGEMINLLKKQKKATKIFFTEVTVEEDDGHLTKLPDVIDVWFPDCTNCEKDKRRR
jgi:hypothetical protein